MEKHRQKSLTKHSNAAINPIVQPALFLIVDDEQHVLETIAEWIQSEGYQCETAGNGKDALERIISHDYNLVITDIAMPRMNGLEFLKKLKRIRPHVPVMIITGYATIENAIEALRLGAVNFMNKPINFNELKISIEKILSVQKRKEKRKDTLRHLVEEKKQFSFPTQHIDVSDVAALLTESLEDFDIVVESNIHSITLAVYEMLTNAVEHGNLELPSEIKFSQPDGLKRFNRLKKERLQNQAYASRLIKVNRIISPYEATLTIEDQGRGFDYNSLPDPTQRDNLGKPHGRGIFLAKQIMDRVIYNEKGNRVTLVLRSTNKPTENEPERHPHL